MNKEQKKRFEEFKAIADKLESKLGITVYGFDPGFLVGIAMGNSVSIPRWLAERIIEKMEENNE